MGDNAPRSTGIEDVRKPMTVTDKTKVSPIRLLDPMEPTTLFSYRLILCVDVGNFHIKDEELVGIDT